MTGDHGPGPLPAGLGRDRPGRCHPQHQGAGRLVRRPACAPWSRPTGTVTAAPAWRGPRSPAGRAGLAVALVDEGVELRTHGVRGPILLLSECGAEAVDTAISFGLTPTVYTPEAVEQFAAAARAHGPRHRPREGRHRDAPCGRAGRGLPALVEPSATTPCSGSRACGRTSRWPMGTATRTAPSRWASSSPSTPRRRARPPSASPVLHAANTAGAIALPARARTWCAAASGSTGTCPAPAVRRPSRAGRGARCGRRWPSRHRSSPCARSRRGSGPPTAGCARCPARPLVATVPIGYADGVPRALFTEGYEVLIGGRRRPLAGMVTMDQIVVDCGDDDACARATRWCCWAARATRNHGGRLGGPARHDQLRGGVRRRPADAARRWSTAPTRPVPDADALERLRVTASTCTRCPLAEGRTQVVFGVGDPTADLLFVGEGPGREEDLAGEPFVGRSGKLLDRLMWEEIGLTRAECYIANVVKCRPPQNRDPAPDEIEACRPYLDEQITLIDPTVIVTLGQLRHQAPARERPGHPRAAGPGLRARPGPWCRPTTPPTCCGPAARPWPRCGPTSSGPSG